MKLKRLRRCGQKVSTAVNGDVISASRHLGVLPGHMPCLSAVAGFERAMVCWSEVSLARHVIYSLCAAILWACIDRG